MIVFKKRSSAQKLCNCANQFPWFNYMVQAKSGGWIVTKAKGVNSNG